MHMYYFQEYDYMSIPKGMNIPIWIKNDAYKHGQCFNDTQSFCEIKQKLFLEKLDCFWAELQ